MKELLNNTYSISGFGILFFIAIMLIILLIARLRTIKIQKLEKDNYDFERNMVQSAEDIVQLEQALKQEGYNSQRIADLKDKYKPEDKM